MSDSCRGSAAAAVSNGMITDALAEGLKDGGLHLITNYPGFHSNELFDRAGGAITSSNERNAYAVAWGAAVAGWRSAVTFKNVGLNDAADAFLNSHALGLTAGLAVVVFDDIDVEHSQLRQDSRHFFRFFGGLWLEPASLQSAYDLAREAFVLSERFGVPVVLRVTNLLYGKLGSWQRRAPVDAPSVVFHRDPARFVMHPTHWEAHRQAMAARQTAIQDWVDARYSAWSPGALEETVHVVCGPAGAGDMAGLSGNPLRVETLPLPEAPLRAVLASGRPMAVHEYGDSVAADLVRSRAGNAAVAALPLSHAHARHRYHCADRHERLFQALRAVPGRVVCGDLGSFTMDPHQTLDVCLCYGASVGVATGMALVRPDAPVFCITGDGAYLHWGRAALDEALARDVSFVLAVFDNGGCRGTGGQVIPGDLRLVDSRVRRVEMDYRETTVEAFGRILSDCLSRRGISLLCIRTD
ncbi:MAG: hypothetical protein GX595_01225 [Lentisphaerae bacterium]|nr:hypothetical protein [Lentisphaerota bacterium]